MLELAALLISFWVVVDLTRRASDRRSRPSRFHLTSSLGPNLVVCLVAAALRLARGTPFFMSPRNGHGLGRSLRQARRAHARREIKDAKRRNRRPCRQCPIISKALPRPLRYRILKARWLGSFVKTPSFSLGSTSVRCSKTVPAGAPSSRRSLFPSASRLAKLLRGVVVLLCSVSSVIASPVPFTDSVDTVPSDPSIRLFSFDGSLSTTSPGLTATSSRRFTSRPARLSTPVRSHPNGASQPASGRANVATPASASGSSAGLQFDTSPSSGDVPKSSSSRPRADLLSTILRATRSTATIPDMIKGLEWWIGNLPADLRAELSLEGRQVWFRDVDGLEWIETIVGPRLVGREGPAGQHERAQEVDLNPVLLHLVSLQIGQPIILHTPYCLPALNLVPLDRLDGSLLSEAVVNGARLVDSGSTRPEAVVYQYPLSVTPFRAYTDSPDDAKVAAWARRRYPASLAHAFSTPPVPADDVAPPLSPISPPSTPLPVPPRPRRAPTPVDQQRRDQEAKRPRVDDDSTSADDHCSDDLRTSQRAAEKLERRVRKLEEKLEKKNRKYEDRRYELEEREAEVSRREKEVERREDSVEQRGQAVTSREVAVKRREQAMIVDEVVGQSTGSKRVRAASSAPTGRARPSLVSYHGMDSVKAGIRATLGVPEIVDTTRTTLVKTGRADLDGQTLYAIDPKFVSDSTGDPVEGVYGCAELAKSQPFGGLLLSLRQTPGEVGGLRMSMVLDYLFETFDRMRVDLFCPAQSFIRVFASPSALEWASREGAVLHLVMDTTTFTKQCGVIEELNKRFSNVNRELKLKDWASPRIRTIVVKTSGIGKQHSKKIVAYGSGCLAILTSSANWSTCGCALDQPESLTVPTNASYETASFQLVPISSTVAQTELNAIDAFTSDLATRKLFVAPEKAMTPNAYDQLSAESKAKRELRRAIEIAREKSRSTDKEHDALLEGYEPRQDLTKSESLDLSRFRREASAVAGLPALGGNIAMPNGRGPKKHEGKFIGFKGCVMCRWISPANITQETADGDRTLAHPAPPPGLGTHPHCDKHTRVGRLLFVISYDEIEASGLAAREYLCRVIDQIEACSLDFDDGKITGIFYGWYASLKTDLVGARQIVTSLNGFIANLEHPQTAYIRQRLLADAKRHGLSRALSESFGPSVFQGGSWTQDGTLSGSPVLKHGLAKLVRQHVDRVKMKRPKKQVGKGETEEESKEPLDLDVVAADLSDLVQAAIEESHDPLFCEY